MNAFEGSGDRCPYRCGDFGLEALSYLFLERYHVLGEFGLNFRSNGVDFAHGNR
jgi:hypothetical protein